MHRPPIELLAPARDLACGLTALECGADAVYIGAERFGARQAAANSRRDIARLTAQAHLFHARVYATLNTILRDAELEAARRLVVGLHEDGVDGLIVQDWGLLGLDLPPLPLIASTQMHNAEAPRLRFLRDLGFSRAILARELSLEEIRSLSRAVPDLELEAFVHGALCVSYSGRCYLSYALGGRSANRGECAQPCRRPYTVRDDAGRMLAPRMHALCLKDLDLSRHLEELLDAGVSSFKIEGRLKGPDYVKNTVLLYRRAVDAALAKTGGRKASSGTVQADFTPDPAKTFNRGFTTYCLRGPDPEMASPASPAFVGEPVDGGRLAQLHPADGLCFFDPAGVLRGTTAARAARSRPGTRLYRNRDHLWIKALAAARVERRLPVELSLDPAPSGLRLTVVDEDGVRTVVEHACSPHPAADPALARRTLERQLGKLGGTPLIAARVSLPPQPPFVSLAVLNSLRREAVAAHLEARLAARPKPRRRPERACARHPDEALGFEANVLNAAARRFLEARGVRRVARALEAGPVPSGTRVMTCRHCLRRTMGSCPRPRTAPPLYLEDGAVRLRLEFDCPRCLMEVYFERGPKR